MKEFGLSLIIIWNYLKIPVQLALNPGFWALPILAQKYDHFSMISEVYASKFGVSMGAGSQQSIVAYHTSCCCLLAFSKLVFTGQLKTIINNNLFYAQNAGNCTSKVQIFLREHTPRPPWWKGALPPPLLSQSPVLPPAAVSKKTYWNPW